MTERTTDQEYGLNKLTSFTVFLGGCALAVVGFIALLFSYVVLSICLVLGSSAIALSLLRAEDIDGRK